LRELNEAIGYALKGGDNNSPNLAGRIAVLLGDDLDDPRDSARCTDRRPPELKNFYWLHEEPPRKLNLPWELDEQPRNKGAFNRALKARN